MAIKVGIPRGLSYYQYIPLWKEFFTELGAQVVISECTNKQILNRGIQSCVDEACLPIKVFHGHVENLKDRVDVLFIPRLTSVSKGEYICPKFGGLPDMVRNNFMNLPSVIDTEINLRKSESNLMKAVFEIGSWISKDRKRIHEAYQKGMELYNKFRQDVKTGVLPSDILDKRIIVSGKRKEDSLHVAVISHGYNLYDPYINMNLIDKLRENDVKISTVEMVEPEIIQKKCSRLQKKVFWNFGRKALGSALHYVERDDIDGIMYIMSFGCGIDSFICDLVERKIKKQRDVPFMVLTLDEHSGEAGLNTRIEAFVDMIRWRRRNENNISTYGEYVYTSESITG